MARIYQRHVSFPVYIYIFIYLYTSNVITCILNNSFARGTYVPKTYISPRNVMHTCVMWLTHVQQSRDPSKSTCGTRVSTTCLSPRGVVDMSLGSHSHAAHIFRRHVFLQPVVTSFIRHVTYSRGAVWCSVFRWHVCCSVLQGVAVCCSVLQCVSATCELQFVPATCPSLSTTMHVSSGENEASRIQKQIGWVIGLYLLLF